jgi:signal transduction histidine kinase
LSLAKAYAQHHDATIAIESAPGAGTVATVAFPPARSVAAAAANIARGAA